MYEADIERAVTEHFIKKTGLRVHRQLNIGDSRADLAVTDVVADAQIIEIKSEHDSPARLARQLLAYHQVAKYVCIASTDTDPYIPWAHLTGVGLLHVYPDGVVEPRLHRDLRIGHTRLLNPDTILGMLRHHEAQEIIRFIENETYDGPNTQRYAWMRNQFRRIHPTDRLAREAWRKIHEREEES